MKRASVLALALIVALCMALPLSGCSSNSYTPEASEQTVDDSALNTAGTLRVGVNASNAPYAQESSGTIKGIDVDVAAALADAMGLKLELVDVGTATSGAFTDEEVDIVMGVSEEGSDYWLSDAYATSGIALFSMTEGESAPTTSGSFTVTAQSASMSAWEVTDHYGADCLESESDLQTAFEALSSGDVDYVAADSTIGGYVAHTLGIDAYPIALLQEATTYSIAVSSSSTALQSAVEEALSSLVDGGVIDVIQKKYLGDQVALSSLPTIVAPESSTEETTDESTDTTTDESTTDTTTTDTTESDTSTTS